MNTISLEAIRATGMRLLTTAAFFLVAISMVGQVVLGHDFLLPAFAFVAILAYPGWLAFRRASDPHARVVITVSMLALPAIMLYAFRGAGWQEDIHMIFFAILAMTAILCDVRALAAGTALVAVHHLLLGLVVPGWVFQSGRAPVALIAMHAVILLAEAGALVFMVTKFTTLINRVQMQADDQRRADAIIANERAARVEEMERVTVSLSEGLSRLSLGDLTKPIDAEFPASYAVLKSDFNNALKALRGLVSGVARGVSATRENAAQIAQSTDDLATRVERTAANVEEASAALAEVSARITAGEHTVGATVTSATSATGSVRAGRAVTTSAVETMERVAHTAQGIDSVIEGLDKIAFQTRVLAMNAAVEAGRAGEAGRGFAVVADLVGQLAMRSEEEAKRAREQLTATQSDVGIAVQTIGQVDTALNAIATAVDDVHGRLATIAEDHAVQMSSLSQVTRAIGMVERFVQQNAAMVEQSSAAASALAGEVDSVARLAEQFQTSAAVGSVPPAAGRGSREKRIIGTADTATKIAVAA